MHACMYYRWTPIKIKSTITAITNIPFQLSCYGFADRWKDKLFLNFDNRTELIVDFRITGVDHMLIHNN